MILVPTLYLEIPMNYAELFIYVYVPSHTRPTISAKASDCRCSKRVCAVQFMPILPWIALLLGAVYFKAG